MHVSSPESLLPRRRSLPHRAAGQDLLVRDPESDVVHFLNPTAAAIWLCCDGETSFGQCEGKLCAAFAVPQKRDVAADVRRVLAEFAAKGLLEE